MHNELTKIFKRYALICVPKTIFRHRTLHITLHCGQKTVQSKVNCCREWEKIFPNYFVRPFFSIFISPVIDKNQCHLSHAPMVLSVVVLDLSLYQKLSANRFSLAPAGQSWQTGTACALHLCQGLGAIILANGHWTKRLLESVTLCLGHRLCGYLSTVTGRGPFLADLR